MGVGAGWRDRRGASLLAVLALAAVLGALAVHHGAAGGGPSREPTAAVTLVTPDHGHGGQGSAVASHGGSSHGSASGSLPHQKAQQESTVLADRGASAPVVLLALVAARARAALARAALRRLLERAVRRGPPEQTRRRDRGHLAAPPLLTQLCVRRV